MTKLSMYINSKGIIRNINYKWKNKIGWIMLSDASGKHNLEMENKRLNKIVLNNEIIVQEV